MSQPDPGVAYHPMIHRAARAASLASVGMKEPPLDKFEAHWRFYGPFWLQMTAAIVASLREPTDDVALACFIAHYPELAAVIDAAPEARAAVLQAAREKGLFDRPFTAAIDIMVPPAKEPSP